MYRLIYTKTPPSSKLTQNLSYLKLRNWIIALYTFFTRILFFFNLYRLLSFGAIKVEVESIYFLTRTLDKFKEFNLMTFVKGPFCSKIFFLNTYILYIYFFFNIPKPYIICMFCKFKIFCSNTLHLFAYLRRMFAQNKLLKTIMYK